MGRKKKVQKDFVSEDEVCDIEDFIEEQKTKVKDKKKKIVKVQNEWNDEKAIPKKLKEKISDVLKDRDLPVLNIKACIKYSEGDDPQELMSVVMSKLNEVDSLKEFNVSYSLTFSMK